MNSETRTDLPRLPSIPQMVNRANPGHLYALQSFAHVGHAGLPSTAGEGQIRGMRTITTTLLNWDCTVTTKEGEVREQIGPDVYAIVQRGQYVTRLTSRGEALLRELEARQRPPLTAEEK